MRLFLSRIDSRLKFKNGIYFPASSRIKNMADLLLLPENHVSEILYDDCLRSKTHYEIVFGYKKTSRWLNNVIHNYIRTLYIKGIM